jgi:PAS domain S-box-containing protein
MHRDINDRAVDTTAADRESLSFKRIAESLAESEQRFSVFMKHLPLVVFIKDKQGRILFANDYLKDLLDDENLIGKTNQEILPPEAAQKTIADDRQALTQGLLLIQDTIRDAYGDERIFDTYKFPIPLPGGRTLLGGISLDITARKKAEEERNYLNNFLQATMDTVSSHLCVIDENGTIVAVNKAWNDFARANPPVTANVSEGSNYLAACNTKSENASQEAADFAGGIRAVIRGELDEFSLIYECSSPTEQRWFIGKVRPFPENGPRRFVVEHHNITDLKQAQNTLTAQQELLEELNRSLEKRVSQSVDELRRKDLMLIQQSRQAAMGEMINNIAHQWRQPLNNIGLIIQNLQSQYEAGEMNSAQMAEQVGHAMDVIVYMSRTIDDFRNFFRQDKERHAFIVNLMVSRSLDFLLPTLKSRGITVESHEQPDIIAEGYPSEYMQVLLNILNNAKDVLLERKVANPLISINIFRENQRSVVTIRDNAGGIPDTVLPKIFDPYFTTKEQGKGTGIGLYMSKTIIEKNIDGSLTARNVEGGVEFRIEI